MTKRTILDVYNNSNTKSDNIQNGDDVFVLRDSTTDKQLLYLTIVNNSTITTASYVPVTDTTNVFARRLTVDLALNQAPESIYNLDLSLKCNPCNSLLMYAILHSGGLKKVYKGKNIYSPSDYLSITLLRSNQKIQWLPLFIDVSKPFTLMVFQRISLDVSSINVLTKKNSFDLYISNNSLYFRCGSANVLLDKNHNYLNNAVLYSIVYDGTSVCVWANNRQLTKKFIALMVLNGLPILSIGNDYSMKLIMWFNGFNYGLDSKEVSKFMNYGRPDKAILPGYMKWGSKTKYNSTYAGNEDINTVAWYSGNATGAMPVGLKRPNAIGLYDMIGNVLEWCWDWYGGTYPSSANNPKGADSGFVRIFRGGSWSNDGYNCRVAVRSYDAPIGSGSNLGFRLCRNYNATLKSNDVVVQAKLAGMHAMGSGTYTDCTIDSFLMQKFPVTVAEYSGSGTDTKPKVLLTWYDAVKFANDKSTANGLDNVYAITNIVYTGSNITSATVTANFSKNGYRLPTEAEWEWAARQGSVGAVADYSAKSIVLNYWYDNLYGYKAKLINNPKLYIMNIDNLILSKSSNRIVKKLIIVNGDTEILIPNGWMIDQILYLNNTSTSGSFTLQNLNAKSIAEAVSYTSTSGTCVLLKKMLSNRDNHRIYITGLTGSVVLTCIMKIIPSYKD